MEEKDVLEDENLDNNSSHYMIVIPLLILLICISIGYSYLSTGLKINGGLGIPKMSWDVHFDNVVEDSDVNIVPTLPATINESKTSVSFDVELKVPGEKYGFDVDIVNEGTINAMLSGYTVRGVNPYQTELIEYHFSYADGDELEQYDLLKAGESDTIHFDIEHSDKLFDQDQNLHISITLDYVQADDNATERG